jgi:hypothetical protein
MNKTKPPNQAMRDSAESHYNLWEKKMPASLTLQLLA